MNKDYIPKFKSDPYFYEKEKSGKKPNTVRKIDPDDERFQALRNGCERIMILKSNSNEFFVRYIIDYTEWEDYAIISFENGILSPTKVGSFQRR